MGWWINGAVLAGTIFVCVHLWYRTTPPGEGATVPVELDNLEEFERMLSGDEGENDDIDDGEDDDIDDGDGAADNGAALAAGADNRAAEALRAAQENGEQPGAPARWKSRGEVGAKKARSLARREQRRAYFEYVRGQAEAQKERDQAMQELFGDLIAEEQEDRRQRSEEARLKREKQIQARRQQETQEREARLERRAELALQLDVHGSAKLKSPLDTKLAEGLGTVIGDGQWVVRVTDDLVARVARTLQDGQASYSEVQTALNA